VTLSLAVIVATVSLFAAGPRVTASEGAATPPTLEHAVDTLLAAADPASQVLDIDAAQLEPEPDVRTVRLRPRPKPGPFRMNLYREGDFVSQATEFWCIAASSQTMMNIMDDGPPRRSKKLQRRLHFQAREGDGRWDWFWEEVAGEPRWDRGLHGLDIRNWQMVLNEKGYGPYEIDRAPTRKQAIRKAARAIRLTGRPAGLVVWRGAHAWVMSGFDATADPAFTNEFKVTRVYVSDPWYPAVSRIWGRSRPPNSAVSVKALAQDYLPWKRPHKRPKRDGQYMLVLPVLPPDVEVVTGG
jgi:hypothetical protein